MTGDDDERDSVVKPCGCGALACIVIKELVKLRRGRTIKQRVKAE